MSLSSATTGGLTAGDALRVSSNPELVQMDELIVEQEAIMMVRTKESQRMREEAQSVLAGGVASSWQDAPPVCGVDLPRQGISYLGRRRV